MKSRGVTTTGVFNDAHMPWHDPIALNIVLDVFEYLKVNRIVINGDLNDFYDIHNHGPKHPEVKFKVTDEILVVHDFLIRLRRRFPKIEIVYIFGNHEDRLERFIIQNCSVFFDLLKLEQQYTLDKLNIKWQPYNSRYRLEKTYLYMQHSPPSYSKNGAMVSLERKLDCSYIYGCTHRKQAVSLTSASGKEYSAYFNGWLGSTTMSKAHTRVFSYVKGHESWQKCFSIVYVLNQKEHWVDQISIKNNKAVYQGKVFK